MKFLIVDDNTGMREMIRAVACTENDIVVECSDGSEALAALSQFHPDVVLMDIEMKVIDGFTASEEMLKRDPSIKIIFITSHNTSAFRLKAQSLKAGFVTKENLSELNQYL
jgi:CheY-like chemotaxis protein